MRNVGSQMTFALSTGSDEVRILNRSPASNSSYVHQRMNHRRTLDDQQEATSKNPTIAYQIEFHLFRFAGKTNMSLIQSLCHEHFLFDI